MCDMTRRLAVVGTIGALMVVGGVTAVPAEAASGPRAVRICTFTGPGDIPLRVKLLVLLRSADDNDVRGIRVRATDRDEQGRFRDSRVRVGRVDIGIEGTVQETEGGAISSAMAVRRQGSPAFKRLNPNGAGSELSQVYAEVVFRLPGGKRSVALCTADLKD